MIERLIDLAENAAVVWAVVNQVVAAVLLECQAGDHIRMAEQLVVCLVLNPDLEAILEVIAAGPIRFPVDVMLQVEIGGAVNAHQDVKGHIIILDLHNAHIGITNDLDYRNPFRHEKVCSVRVQLIILRHNIIDGGVEVHGIYIAGNPLPAQSDLQVRHFFCSRQDAEQCPIISGFLQLQLYRRSENAGGLAQAGMRGISAAGDIDEEIILCAAAVIIVITQGMGTGSFLIQAIQPFLYLFCGFLLRQALHLCEVLVSAQFLHTDGAAAS